MKGAPITDIYKAIQQKRRSSMKNAWRKQIADKILFDQALINDNQVTLVLKNRHEVTDVTRVRQALKAIKKDNPLFVKYFVKIRQQKSQIFLTLSDQFSSATPESIIDQLSILAKGCSAKVTQQNFVSLLYSRELTLELTPYGEDQKATISGCEIDDPQNPRIQRYLFNQYRLRQNAMAPFFDINEKLESNQSPFIIVKKNSGLATSLEVISKLQYFLNTNANIGNKRKKFIYHNETEKVRLSKAQAQEAEEDRVLLGIHEYVSSHTLQPLQIDITLMLQITTKDLDRITRNLKNKNYMTRWPHLTTLGEQRIQLLKMEKNKRSNKVVLIDLTKDNDEPTLEKETICNPNTQTVAEKTLPILIFSDMTSNFSRTAPTMSNSTVPVNPVESEEDRIKRKMSINSLI